jgi:hypothetical protein
MCAELIHISRDRSVRGQTFYRTKDCGIDQVNEMVMKIFRFRDDKQSIEQLCKNGEQFYEGYIDDHRNTDNAWLEALIFIYHDDDGKLLSGVDFQVRLRCCCD